MQIEQYLLTAVCTLRCAEHVGIIGIPTMFLLLSVLGDYWIDICRFANRQTFGSCRGFRSRTGKIRQRYTVLWMIVLVFSYLGCMALVFLSLPDSDSVRRQPKNYEEGYYFAFVTFSTIGFGDYFIGDDNLGYTVLQLFTIFMGLAVLSALIAILQQTLHKIIAKADYIIISMAEEEEYDDDTVLINAERQDISVCWQARHNMHLPSSTYHRIYH
eukprot:m.356439 g.356439  ORF g.356439 m.356439 type:complete len:215 (-) comp20753_c0_seq5:158-802(-)